MDERKLNQVGSMPANRHYPMPVVGRICGADDRGILVAFDNREPVRARLFAAGVELSELMRSESVGREVLISCEEGDPLRPIITGVFSSFLDELIPPPETSKPMSKATEVRVDGKRLVFEADQEIELKCGKSSITLKKNGKIIIKGSELLSRASGTNRIKGGSVGIN